MRKYLFVFFTALLFVGCVSAQPDTASVFIYNLPAKAVIDSHYVLIAESPTTTYKITWKALQRSLNFKKLVQTTTTSPSDVIAITHLNAGKDTTKGVKIKDLYGTLLKDSVQNQIGIAEFDIYATIDSLDSALVAAIGLKANIVSVDSLKNRMTSAESSILLKAGKAEVDGLRDSLWAEVNTKASISTVNDLANSVTNAEAAILLKANKSYVDSLGLVYLSLINLKANVTTTDSLRNRISSAESSLLLKASQTYVEELGTALNASIALKANVSYADSINNAAGVLTGRVTTAEAGITANANAIVGLDGEVADITSSLLLYAKKDSIISFINITPETIKISAAKIELDGVAIADSLFGQLISGAAIETYTADGYGKILMQNNTLTFKKPNATSIDVSITAGVLSGGRGNLSLPSIAVGETMGGSYSISATGDIYTGGNLVATQAWVALQGYQSSAVPTTRTLSINGTSYDLSLDRSWTISETDPTIYAWAKAAAKPSYSYSEVGASAATHGNESHSSAFIVTETDPSVYAWAKAATKPSYSYSEVGAASSSHNHDASYTTPGWVAANFSVIGHGHDGTTIDGLTVADFTSANISQWTNNAGYLTAEVDGSTTNEIQTLGTSGNTITLTSGGSVTAPYATTAGGVTNAGFNGERFLATNNSGVMVEASIGNGISIGVDGSSIAALINTSMLEFSGGAISVKANTYHSYVSGGKTITYSVEDANLDVWTSQYSNGVLISLKKNGVEQ